MQPRMLTAAALIIVGLTWIGQGSGLLVGRSFMVGDIRWAVAGVVAVVAGALLALSARRGSRPGA